MRSALSRRSILRAGGAAAAGAAGVAILAACGETQVVTKEVPVEKTIIKEVPVEKIVTQVVERIVTQEVEKTVEKVVTQIVEVEKIVSAEPQAISAVIRFASDHTSGPRGAAMSWALDRFKQTNPGIIIKLEPQSDLYMDSFGIQISAGTQAELALLDGGFIQQWVQAGAFTQINETLAKHADWDPNRWYFTPDEYSVVFADSPTDVHLTGIAGPQWGMPYQGNINGFMYNMTMMEAAGIEWPTAGKWGLEAEFLDAIKKGTDPSNEVYGLQMNYNGWVVWGSWARATQNSGQHMWRTPDGSRWDIFEDGGDRGYTVAIETIHTHKVAPPLADTKKLSGDVGDPFSAGKVMITWTGGGVGNQTTRINNRFAWGLGMIPEGPNDRGEAPHHFTDQPHMASNAAESNGTVEQSVEVLMFFAGEEVQGRIAVDRGSLPLLKSVIESPEQEASPPENHGMYKQWMDKVGNHHWQNAHPAWWEWYQAFEAPQKAFNGEETPEQSIEAVITISDGVLAETQAQYDEYKTWIGTLSS